MSSEDYFRLKSKTVLSDQWGELSRYEFDLKTRSGAWQSQRREAYDRGNGVACLLHDPKADTVLLIRQFRLPAAVNGHGGFLIEVPAGMLDGAEPEQRMREELEEETGYRVSTLSHLSDIFISPGSVTEYISFYKGTYSRADRAGPGGGNSGEGEDIEVLHVPFDDAMAMVATGKIRDAKTIILLQHLALERAT